MDELNIRDTNEFLFPFFFLDNYNSTKNFPNDATIIRLDFNFFDSSLEGKIRDENLHWLES